MAYRGQKLRQGMDKVLAAVATDADEMFRRYDPRNEGAGVRHPKSISLAAQKYMGRDDLTYVEAKLVVMMLAMWEQCPARLRHDFLWRLPLELDKQTTPTLG